MSNLPPNPYNSVQGPQMNANTGPQMYNHSQQFNQVPVSQLPPGYGMKPDANSNSPLHTPESASNNFVGQVQNANFNQSGSSSPAFNHQGMIAPIQSGLQSSPMRPAKPTSVPSHQLPPQRVPLSSPSPGTLSNANASPISQLSQFPTLQRHINDNAPPLIPSSQYNHLLTNGPPMTGPPNSVSVNQYPASTSGVNPNPIGLRQPTSSPMFSSGPVSTESGQSQTHPGQPITKPPLPMATHPSLSFPKPPMSPPTTGTFVSGPPVSVPPGPTSGSITYPSKSDANFGGAPIAPMTSGPAMLPPNISSVPTVQGQPMGTVSSPSSNQVYSAPHKNGPSGQPMKPFSGPMGTNVYSGVQSMTTMPPGPQSLPIGQQIGISQGPHTGLASGPIGLPSGPTGLVSGPIGLPSGPTGLPSRPTGLPSGPTGLPSGLTGIPSSLLNQQPMSNIQTRYPQLPQGNYNHPNMPAQPKVGGKYGYNAQGITKQMGQLSVTQQGYDQLWGHRTVDLLQCRHILPEYPEDPPEIRLGNQFTDSANCSPEIFRCTVNRIPDTNSLLQKSRLPLGILIHPFKDLNHLPVIQCTSIVRCRACRTYINPFVYFVDSKRWKCNLCYRVNDLPEEFQYDPVSKSYGDPSRRPEIKSATIEFIAPSEYMLRPPQPAVYLFLMDISQIARDSGYLQIVCETLKNSLDQLPGDARTQVGFICYDAHVHYYLMSDGLTRPKEMTILDIDDVFLPSPESLLVNLGERRELVKELLTVLPQRYSSPGVPASALGAALQAAYKLMAPTGGRITVFQTCLPNIGPGALQPREDPNARSSKDVAHLNPATDFYKRLALDCSGAQVAVDLFLLNSQYADLATLSGMSKFSAGTVYHIPLFRATRTWQADQLRRMFGRYLTRKIGFEAVMRVRCTRGISIHTFHGNFFVRSTDLLSLPNVSPDSGFGMQLTIEESLSDLQQVCFQAALLYTSSKGERRIRVHTLALPIASNLTDVLHSADQQCIIGLLSKMAVDRCVSASMSEAREAVMNVAVDTLSAYRLAQNLPVGSASAALLAPHSLRLLPLYLLALLKRKAFRTGTSTRLDDRVADMCDMKCLPLAQLLRAVYPDLYPVHALQDHLPRDDDTDEEPAPDPPRLHLSAERINSTEAYLLDDGETMVVYVCHAVSAAYLSDTFGVAAFSQLPDEARSLPRLRTDGSRLLHALIDKLNDDRPYPSNVLLLKDNSPSRQLFTERLVDDRVESAFSYYEFLQHVKSQVK